MSEERSGQNDQVPVPTVKGATILVVDDNEDILGIIQRILAKQDYQIFTAREGRQGLKMAREILPDVILLDVMLPEMDGLTVCRQLKSDPSTKGMMILLVTGRGSIDHRAEGLDAGADDYIPKPFHITELLARVRSALRIKRLTDELRERNRQLVDSQRERLRSEKMATIGLLATGIAHEFNNILQGISGYAQLASRNPKFREQFIQVALTQSERALELTRSLSTFYRPSREKRPVVLGEVVESALCLVTKQLEERRISVERDLAPVRNVQGSSGELQEVILNLIINAIQAIGKDGTIEIALEDEGGEIRLSVRDNGCGIPPASMERIFDPFFTTKGALGGGTEGGSGLGLSVSYNIVRAHGGSIAVASEPGKGTVFTVTLPPLDESVTEVSAGSVLVADPDEAVREMLAQYLGARKCLGVRDWTEALGELRKEPFEFAVIDADLPGLPAPREAIEAIRAVRADAGLVFTSRRFPESDLRQALPDTLGHLLKPYNVENLLGVMARQPSAVEA